MAHPAAQGRREWLAFSRRLARRRTALFGAVVVAVVLAVALAAPLVSPFDPLGQDLENRLKPPGWQDGAGYIHPLGTDHLGRDILARVIFGARPALLVGVAAVLISGVLGMIAGLLSGYFGGPVDDVLMRLADIQLAFPFILLAIAVIGVLGPSLVTIIAVIGVSSWVIYARVVRGAVLSIREREFIQAAQALGVRDWRVLVRHILPNAFTPWLVVALSSWDSASSRRPRRGEGCSPTGACTCRPRGGWPPFPGSPSWWPCSGSICSATAFETRSTHD